MGETSAAEINLHLGGAGGPGGQFQLAGVIGMAQGKTPFSTKRKGDGGSKEGRGS